MAFFNGHLRLNLNPLNLGPGQDSNLELSATVAGVLPLELQGQATIPDARCCAVCQVTLALHEPVHEQSAHAKIILHHFVWRPVEVDKHCNSVP